MHKRLKIYIFSTLFALVSLIALTQFFAASPWAAIEGEDLEIESSYIVADPDASQENYIQFNGTNSTTEQKVIGYYFGVVGDPRPGGLENRKPLSALPLNDITHLVYAFALTNGGVCSTNAASQADLTELKALKSQYPNLKTLLSFGGGGSLSDDIPAAIASPERRSQFIDSCIGIMRQYGMDGIDDDWETGVEATSHLAMSREFRQKLDAVGAEDGKRYLLTAAPVIRVPGQADQNWREAEQYFDWLAIQLYEQCNGNWDDVYPYYTCLDSPIRDYPDFSSDYTDNLNAETLMNDLRTTYGVANEKIIFGVPFYGKFRNGVVPGNNGLYRPATGTGGAAGYSYAFLEQYIGAAGWQEFWEPTSQVNWFYNAGAGEFFSVETPRSLCEKAKYVDSNGYGGIMVWEITQDSDSNDLMNGILQGYKQMACQN